MFKKLIKNLADRISMRKIENCRFVDVVDGQSVHLYQDRTGDKYMANSIMGAMFGFRVKKD